MTPEHARPIRILLYVDRSKDWHTVARVVGEFARRVPCHVIVTSSVFFRKERERELTRAKELLALPPEQVELIGRPGLLEYTLPSTARRTGADAVVVGRLGSTDVITSGRVAHLIAKRTPASVLVARRPRPIRSILVCTEGKRSGIDAFEGAALVAKALGARLDILHVVSQMGLTDTARAKIDADLRDFVRSDAPDAAHLRDLEERLRVRGLEGRAQVRAGLVVEEIVDAVREGAHDLLVIGAHDIGAPGSHLYEDLASLIIRASPVSTLVVRHRTPRPVNEQA